MAPKRICVNDECPKCGAPAYVGLHTRVECTRGTCENAPGMRALDEEWRARVRRLRKRLDELDDEQGPIVEQAKKDIQAAIDRILSVDPLH